MQVGLSWSFSLDIVLYSLLITWYNYIAALMLYVSILDVNTNVIVIILSGIVGIVYKRKWPSQIAVFEGDVCEYINSSP